MLMYMLHGNAKLLIDDLLERDLQRTSLGITMLPGSNSLQFC